MVTDPSNAKLSVTRPRLAAKRCGLGVSTMYEKINRGEFPKPLKIGARAAAFLDSELDAWIEARIADRDANK